MTQSGRDVSGWQGSYGFPAVDFTIAKATEGSGFRDPQWTRNQRILLQPGPMVGGSYHFFRGNPNEVDWYLSQHDSAVFHPDVAWIFVLDAEDEGNAASVNQFLSRLKARIGYDPWFYSYGAWINARPGIDRSYPLWIAAPSSPMGQPPNYGWAAITAHQYGTVDGVDANLFLGDRSALLKLAGIGSASPVQPTGEEFMHRVVKGDQKPACWKLEGNTKQWIRIVPQLQHLIATSAFKTLEVWPQYVVDRIPRLEDVPEDLTGTGLTNYEDVAFRFTIARGVQLEPAGAPAGPDLPAPLTVDKFPY